MCDLNTPVFRPPRGRAPQSILNSSSTSSRENVSAGMMSPQNLGFQTPVLPHIRTPGFSTPVNNFPRGGVTTAASTATTFASTGGSGRSGNEENIASPRTCVGGRRPTSIICPSGSRSNRENVTPRNNIGGARETSRWSTSSRTTTGTTKSGSGSSVAAQRMVIVAIMEGREQDGQVGMACMVIGSATLVLSEFLDSQNYSKTLSKLNIFQPSKILMTSSACSAATQSRMYQQIQKELDLVEVIPIQKKLYNYKRGLQKIRSLVNEEFKSIPLIVAKNYYLLAAAAALFEYLEVVRSVNFMPNTLKIDYQSSGQTAQIDTATVKDLELLVNNNDLSCNYSLLEILNVCKTPMGSRLLRATILQPPFNENVIKQRLDCVDELKNNRELLYNLQAHLSSLSADVDHVISNLIHVPRFENEHIKEQRINFILVLKNILRKLPAFAATLENSAQPHLQAMSRDFQKPVFESMRQRIQSVINDESQVHSGAANMLLQRTFAVKAQVNEMLDIGRRVYCEIIGDINDYVLQLSREHGYPLQLCETPFNGLYLQFKLRDAESARTLNLPKQFLKVRRVKATIRCSTQELIVMHQRVKVICSEILDLSYIVICQLVEDIRQEIGSLYKVSEAIANLDLLHSLAVYATLFNTVKPRFSGFATIIKGGRHPILDSLTFEPPVANDTMLSSDFNLNLITGPNMSGKTTYLKQVALLQIMAQIGSFVPAESATFRIADAIFSRLCTDDNIEGNASSFAVEMTEMNHILRNSTESSLIIIDELGRATSVELGIAMSWSMLESLLKSSAFVVTATHFLILTELEFTHLNALNYKMETEEETWQHSTNEQATTNCSLRYEHVCRRGVTQVRNYGLKLAKIADFPDGMLDEANTIVEQFTPSRGVNSGGHGEADDPKRLYHLASKLAIGSESRVHTSPAQIRCFLKSLKSEFVQANN